MIYFIQVGEDGPVKIGHGNNPGRRLHNLQLGCPDKLRLLGVIDGGEAEERSLHQRFADLRVRGEWYRFSPQFLTGLRPLKPPRGLGHASAIDPKAHPCKRYRKQNGLTLQQLGDIVGVSRVTIFRIESGLNTPSLALLQRFIDRTDLRAEDFLRQDGSNGKDAEC